MKTKKSGGLIKFAGKTNTVAKTISPEVASNFIEIVKTEIGDYKLTKEMRKEAAERLGVDETTADKWQNVVDVLDHIDL